MKFKLIAFFLTLSSLLSAQTDSLHISSDRFIRVNYDNDYFSATDRYYTQGVRIEFISPFVKKSPLSKLLVPISKNSLCYYGIAIERDGFTPISIRHNEVYLGERPYAGVMFFSHFLTSVNAQKRQRLTTQFDIGIIGPAVGGKQEQTAIHRAIGNLEPLGWQHQIANDAVINYTVQFEQGLYTKKYLECIALANARAGTLYDDIAIGGMIRSGWMSSYFNSLGLSRKNFSRKFQCYVFAKANIKAVAYNGTMQGGVFNRNSEYIISSKDISRIVGIGSAGIVLAYKQVSIEYTKAYISPEFSGGLDHGWGHCNISVCF